MAKIKSAATGKDVSQFIHEFTDDEQKRRDSFELIEIMKETTGHEPYMWGSSIIGFGNYHYKYASGHEGDAPLAAFSPRKAAITLYVTTGSSAQDHLLEGFGKYKMSKACIYIKKLADINQDKLKAVIQDSIGYIQKKYPAQ